MPYKVMLVDDEGWVIESLKANVDWQAYGFEVVGTAYNGAEALRLMEADMPDLVMTDVRMPVMSGLDLIKKGGEMSPRVEFVVVSGYAEFAYAQKALKYGAMAYCLKPFEEQEIVGILEQFKRKQGRPERPEPGMDDPRGEPPPRQADDEERQKKENIAEEAGKDVFQSILQYIRNHYTEDISIQSLSQRFYMNPNYLSQLFKKEVQMNFTPYVTKLRMDYACRLLDSTNLMVGEIGERSGYADYFYFTRTFKKTVGMTPTQYRERNSVRQTD